jgi:hypothetical protein
VAGVHPTLRVGVRVFGSAEAYDAPVLRLEHVTFSCEEPARVAEFWAQLLDYEAAGAGDRWLATDPRGEGTALLFSRMP